MGTSPKELTELFNRECVEQRNLDWARAESDRIVGTCRAFPAGPGETQDCEEDVVGQVSWTVATTAGSDVLIELAFVPATSEKAICRLSVDTRLAPALEQAAAGISLPHEYRRRRPSEIEWGGRMDVRGQWDGYFTALARKHPYVLEYRP